MKVTFETSKSEDIAEVIALLETLGYLTSEPEAETEQVELPKVSLQEETPEVEETETEPEPADSDEDLDLGGQDTGGITIDVPEDEPAPINNIPALKEMQDSVRAFVKANPDKADSVKELIANSGAGTVTNMTDEQRAAFWNGVQELQGGINV